MGIVLDHATEAVSMIGAHRRGAKVKPISLAHGNFGDRSSVEACRFLRHRERAAIGHQVTRNGATCTLFVHRTEGHDSLGTTWGIPEEAGPRRPAPVSGRVQPPVFVQIMIGLLVKAAHQRITPIAGQGGRGVARNVVPVAAGGIEEKFSLSLVAWFARDQVDDAPESRRPIQRRFRSLDDFHSSKVGWRNLQQSD